MPSAKKPVRSYTAEASALKLLEREITWGRKVLTDAAKKWWDASISGKPEDYLKMERAEKAVTAHYARKALFEQIDKLLASPKLTDLTRRRLERQRNAFHSGQAPRDRLERIVTQSAALAEKYSTFRGTLDGKECSDNELEEILRTTQDSKKAKAAWEARKQIGRATAEDVRALAVLRNEAAQAIGFPDYWHQKMVLDELDPQKMIDTLEAVDQATAASFTAMKAELDRHISEKFDEPVEMLRPWHYGDPFFQETPEVFAPSQDEHYTNRDVVEMSAEHYRRMGFPNIDAILARSDVYPRDGKNQHAYAVDIDREGDVRTFLNVQNNSRWMGTLLHELGHTIYQDGLDRVNLQWDLRDDPQGFMNEGFAMFCEGPMFEPSWMNEMADIPLDEAEKLAPQLIAQEKSALLAFLRWCLVIVNFERFFYADPSQDVNKLWWDLVEKYQQVTRPEGRDEPDWASKIHVAVEPVYYHKYLYGRLFGAQLTDEMNSRFGGWWAGRKKSGQYIKETLFEPGAIYRWPEQVARVTGKPLGVEALAKSVEWTGR